MLGPRSCRIPAKMRGQILRVVVVEINGSKIKMSEEKLLHFGQLSVNKSVPHVFEKIFFSLDYDSFLSCGNVCKAWNELFSTESYREELKKMLIEKREKEENLRRFTWDGNMKEVQHLLSSGVNPNAGADPNKATDKRKIPLYSAIWTGQKEMVEQLNIADNWGQTPLRWAAAKRCTDMAKLLLDAGADPNKASQSGRPPLYTAIWNDNKEMDKLLLDSGAEPNIEDNSGKTPLRWAAKQGVLALLVAQPGDHGRHERRLHQLGQV